MRYMLIPLVVAACGSPTITDGVSAPRSGGASLSAAPSHHGPVQHSVTGSATQKIAPGFEYAMNVSVHSDAAGNVWGEATTRIIDLSAFGLAGSGEIVQAPECMRVVGNTAYVGLVITKTFDPAAAPVGSRSVFWVRDGGPGANDVAHGGPALLFDPDNRICSTTPPVLPPDALTTGNFVVR